MPRKNKWIKRIIVVALIAAAALGIAASLRPDPIPVEVGRVVRGPLVVTVDGVGKTRMVERQTVYAPVMGELLRIGLKPGDRVTAGQVVARILPGLSQPLDSRSRAEITARLAAARAGLAEAERNVERTEIGVDLARSEATRAKLLVDAQSAPARALEVAEAEEKTRTAERDLAHLAVERARLEAAAVSAALGGPGGKGKRASTHQIDIAAPTNGVVLRIHAESAGPVQPGAPLLDIGDPSAVELVVDLPTQEAMRVSPGAVVHIDGLGNNGKLSGTVRLIEPAAYTKITALGVEEQRVNVIVDLIGGSSLSAALGDGFAADAHIEVHKAEGMLKALSGAIFREGAGFAAFKVDNGRVKLIRVKVKNRSVSEVEVEGVKEGTRLVVHPSDKLKDGVAVVVE